MPEETSFIVKFFDKSYEDKSILELVDAPVSAISGVSESDGDYLDKAFGIKTVLDFAGNKYVRLAQGITNFSDCSGDILDKDYELEQYVELAEKPVEAISGVSDNDATLLKKAFNIKTIRDLAENKYVMIAQTTVTLAALIEMLIEAGMV